MDENPYKASRDGERIAAHYRHKVPVYARFAGTLILAAFFTLHYLLWNLLPIIVEAMN